MGILSALAPHAEKLLYGVALLVLIALFGGTRIHIKDLQLGPLTGLARALAATAGGLLFLAFLLATSPVPVPTFPVEGKLVVGVFRDLAVRVEKVGLRSPESSTGRWLKVLPVHEAPVADRDGGFFSFPASEALEEGRYVLTIHFRDGATKEASVVIAKDQLLLVVTDDGGTQQVSEDPIIYFRGRYNGFWAKKVQAIEHISDLVQRYPERYRQRLVDAYRDQPELRELALWALGGACDFVVKADLEAIYENEGGRFTEYDRLRAGDQLMACFPDHSDIYEDFFERLLTPLPEGSSRQDTVIRRLAAFYLLKRDRIDRCVLKELIFGPPFSKRDSEDMILIMLASMLRWRDELGADAEQALDWDMAAWRAWLDQHESALKPCATTGGSV